MNTYPQSLPCPSRIEGHSQNMSAGLVRTPMQAGNARQRRTHRILPTQVSLVFMIDQSIYAAWLTWVNDHAFDDWVSMRLPGLAASQAGTDTAPVLVRFMTDIQAELVPVHRLWWWRVRVMAEYLPTPEQLLPQFPGDWIIGGTPDNPSPDWIVGGAPSFPSPIFTNPGTPHDPAVLV